MPGSRHKSPSSLRPPTTPAPRHPLADGDAADRRFCRQNRLTDASGYSAVFANASRSRDALFTVLYRRKGEGPARLGLAVAKKHCRLATGRNRIKRLIRESFRHHKDQLRGIDLVVMNTRATTTADKRSIADSLRRHWAQCVRPDRRNRQQSPMQTHKHG